MSLSDDQIRRIARLARIAIGDAESAEVRSRLNRVLGLIDELQAVDTEGIQPMSHPLEVHLPQGQPLREDKVTETDRRAAYQSGAPAVEGGLYLVPQVIE
ncbi:MAG TPA: Asp-tRNA(Asn)/Glu-tRNA(Gln) amidotransferase subunit GatC [Burkholderiales bacterium]